MKTTNKQAFITEVEAFRAQLSAEAQEYFDKTVRAKKVNKKEQEKAEVMRAAILSFLEARRGEEFTREEIGDALNDAAEFDEEYITNDKGGVAYGSITSFANQLVADGFVNKNLVKVGKSDKVKYSVV